MDRTGTLTIIVFIAYIAGVFVLAALSSRVLNKKSFLSEYFLGSRGLGTWALAFTFAATSASGGSFGGYPSLIYSYGWILALWIAGYMVFPLTTMGILGKRLNQVARRAGAITIPDIFRDRFDSPFLGLFASVTIIILTLCVLVGQFKLGAVIIEDTFNLHHAYSYAIGLLVFGGIVIVYTSFGGFRAVVWTDVMQGIVMGLGVIALVPIVVGKAGGLQSATERLMASPATAIASVPAGSGSADRYNDLVFRATEEPAPDAIIYREDNDAIAKVGHAWQRQTDMKSGTQTKDLILLLSANHEERATGNDVIEYVRSQPELSSRLTVDTAYRNNEASTAASGEVTLLGATDTIGFPAGKSEQRFVFRRGAELAFGPGRTSSGKPFHPLGMLISYFFMWSIAGIAQPGMMVRLMAFRDSRTLKRSMLTVTIYYALIYLPLIFVVMAARDALETLPPEHSDRTIVLIATRLVADMGLGYQFLGAIFVAAPFAAVMSTVDSFLLLISSSAVRDIYQRSINPQVSDRTIARISYTTTFISGVIVSLLALQPPTFLQYIVVFVSAGFATAFLAPMVLGLYWSRTTRRGAIAAMVGGFATILLCYVPTFFGHEAIYLLGLHPVMPSLLVSFALGIGVSLADGPPDPALVKKFF